MVFGRFCLTIFRNPNSSSRNQDSMISRNPKICSNNDPYFDSIILLLANQAQEMMNPTRYQVYQRKAYVTCGLLKSTNPNWSVQTQNPPDR
jgi:hypothetical protein